MSVGVFNVLLKFRFLGTTASVITSPGLILGVVFIGANAPLPDRYCAARVELGVKSCTPAVISVGVLRVCAKFKILGATASVITSPGLITTKSLIILNDPLPDKYCAANAALGVKSLTPAVMSVGVLRFLEKSKFLGATASVKTSPGLVTLKSLITLNEPLPLKY